MKVPYLKKKSELKTCHNVEWEDNYSWIHQQNILEVLKIAKTIASKSNLTIKIGKQSFYKQLEMPLRKAYAYTSKMMTVNMMAADAKEGISAFLEKRSPKWKHK